MRGTIRKSMTAIALAALSAAPAAADCPGLTVFGLTDDQRLVRFRECDPEKLKEVGYITGLSGDDEALVGVDFRVQDGRLYGVGDGGGVYVLDTKTAAATFASQITIDLDGTNFGVDFNPAADRLRIISDAGQNLRHNVIPGFVTLLDSALNYTAGTSATGISGAAYTNNDLAADTATTLFDLDGSLDQVAIRRRPTTGRSRPRASWWSTRRPRSGSTSTPASTRASRPRPRLRVPGRGRYARPSTGSTC